MAAAVDTGGESRGPRGKKKGRKKKGSPWIDMTPMVDVAFLLLTFFVLTTTLSTPTTMPVVVPPKMTEKEKEEHQEKIQASKVLHLIVDEDDKIYWYQASEEELKEGNIELNQTDFSKNGLRKVLLQVRKKVEEKWGPNQMVVLIKVTDKAKYKNFVDVLDEMNVVEQRKYMLVEPEPEEIEMVEEYKAKLRGES